MGTDQEKRRPDLFPELAGEIIGGAIEVRKSLGPGVLESAYESCLAFELATRGLDVERQVALPIRYKDHSVDAGYRLDLVVDRKVIVELKSVEKVQPIHEAQLLTYLRLSGIRVGLPINFNVTMLRDGIIRRVI